MLSRREFVRVAAGGVAGSFLAFPGSRSLAAAQRGVPASRLNRLAKGANVCQWFRFVRREDAGRLGNYITEQEAKQMRQMGLTHVRLCLQPKVIMDQTTGAVRKDHASFLKAAIERFHRAGLLVVVELHNEDRPSEINPEWQSAFVRFWGDLAARLQQFDPDLTIFEIINEPVFAGREAEWNPFNARLAGAIRKSAPEHTIMTSGTQWGGIEGLLNLSLLEDPNVAKISVVGVGMRSHAGVAKTMFRALADKAINIQVISTSEIKVSVLIAAEYTELAVRALHTAYGLDAC